MQGDEIRQGISATEADSQSLSANGSIKTHFSDDLPQSRAARTGIVAYERICGGQTVTPSFTAFSIHTLVSLFFSYSIWDCPR